MFNVSGSVRLVRAVKNYLLTANTNFNEATLPSSLRPRRTSLAFFITVFSSITTYGDVPKVRH